MLFGTIGENMALIDVVNIQGQKVSQIELADDIFNVPIRSDILHEIVTMQLASRRAGTAKVKRRSEVRGSTRKLFRQKGTGRARRGDIRSPLLRGGGVTFGPTPRSYAYSAPKKVRRLALKMALSSKLQGQSLIVVQDMDLLEIKTKAFLQMATALGAQNALYITDVKREKLELSSRNVPKTKVLRHEGLNVYDILKYDKLVLSASSLKDIEGRLQV